MEWQFLFDRKEGGINGESLNWGMLWGQRGLSRANRRGTRLDPSSFPTLFYGNLSFHLFWFPAFGATTIITVLFYQLVLLFTCSLPPPTRHVRKEQD